MKIAKKRCEFCHEWFSPHPRTARFQRSCAKPGCRKKRSTSAVRRWWAQNPGYNKGRGPKIRDWAKAYPSYWQKYRKEHPDYAKKERQRRCSAHKRTKNAAKQNAISQFSLEKLESIRNLEPLSAAKQNTIHRRVNGILDYLFWKESIAKQDAIAIHLPGERQYQYASRNLGRDKAIESG